MIIYQSHFSFVLSDVKETKTMKGPRQREASQPATDPNLRPPAEKGEKQI